MNAINVIIPYRWEGLWVFDDAKVGLDKEPFVEGADDIIDLMVADFPDAEKGFRLFFAADRFPSAQFEFEWRRAEVGGNWYYIEAMNKEGWLCPALFKYFDQAPEHIYVKVESQEH